MSVIKAEQSVLQKIKQSICRVVYILDKDVETMTAYVCRTNTTKCSFKIKKISPEAIHILQIKPSIKRK